MFTPAELILESLGMVSSEDVQHAWLGQSNSLCGSQMSHLHHWGILSSVSSGMPSLRAPGAGIHDNNGLMTSTAGTTCPAVWVRAVCNASGIRYPAYLTLRNPATHHTDSTPGRSLRLGLWQGPSSCSGSGSALVNEGCFLYFWHLDSNILIFRASVSSSLNGNNNKT